jgi:hypothetical protein
MTENVRETRVRLLAISYYVTLLIGTLIGMVLTIENAMLDTAGSIAILLLGIGGMYQFLGMIGPDRDERAARIGMKAMTISWTSVLFTISLTLIAEGLVGIEIGGYRILGLSLVVMMISLFISNAYLQRSGSGE